MHRLATLSLTCALCAAACSGDSGPDHPAGAAGEGPVADAGVAGPRCTGASTAAYAPGVTTAGELTHAGAVRTFRVHVPPSYDGSSPRPLVLMLHGGGGSARQLELASAGMNPIADREGFVAVYPDGTGALRTWNGGGCCGRAVTDAVDDVGFVAALLDHLERELCLDRGRVYASGMSNGAILSHRLACELSERVVAIAPVAGTDLTSSCEPALPVAVMQIHGTDDGHVPWDGGVGCGPSGADFTSVPATIDGWRERNGCAAATTVYFEQGDGSCERYEGCTDGGDVVLCSVEGGGHSWPGGAPPAGLVECPANGAQSLTFLASEAIWSFFSEHARAR